MTINRYRKTLALWETRKRDLSPCFCLCKQLCPNHGQNYKGKTWYKNLTTTCVWILIPICCGASGLLAQSRIYLCMQSVAKEILYAHTEKFFYACIQHHAKCKYPNHLQIWDPSMESIEKDQNKIWTLDFELDKWSLVPIWLAGPSEHHCKSCSFMIPWINQLVIDIKLFSVQHEYK